MKDENKLIVMPKEARGAKLDMDVTHDLEQSVNCVLERVMKGLSIYTRREAKDRASAIAAHARLLERVAAKVLDGEVDAVEAEARTTEEFARQMYAEVADRDRVIFQVERFAVPALATRLRGLDEDPGDEAHRAWLSPLIAEEFAGAVSEEEASMLADTIIAKMNEGADRIKARQLAVTPSPSSPDGRRPSR